MDARARLARSAITGLVLCGGRGQRMGGQDKGWLLLNGAPLVALALARLAPQVGPLAISANRNLARYAALGYPVWADDADHRCAGPLAGMAAALTRMDTPWLAVTPCDMPSLPASWVANLASAAQTGGAPLAMAALRAPGGLHAMPVVALLHQRVLPALQTQLQAGERRVGEVLTRLGAVVAAFDDASAFVNVNTPSELARMSEPDGAGP